MKFCILN